MPIYEIEDPKTKQVYEIDAPQMPSGAQIEGLLLTMNKGNASAQPAGPRAPVTGRGTQLDLGRSQEFAQGLGSAVPFVGPEMPMSGPGVVGALAGNAALAAVPVTKAIQALPTMAKAGKKFQQVMGAAKNVPVDISEPGNVALRIADLAQRGGGTNWGPAPVRQFIQYVTDPKRPEMTYEVARDFASNISRLSAKDLASVPPKMMSEIHRLRMAMNKAVGEAAETVGKGAEYSGAMREYARAAKLKNAATTTGKALTKAALPTAAMYAGYRTLGELLGWN